MFRRRQTILNGLIKKPNAREVRISIIFTRLGEIDTINERFSCEATLFITWSESINLIKKFNIENIDDTTFSWDSKHFWDPQLYIDNAIGDVKEKDVKFHVKKLYDENKKEWFIEVHMIKRIQGTFFEKLELYHFPFDIQDLSITVTSHRASEEIFLVQDFSIPPKMTKSASLDKHIWKLYDHVNVKIHTIKNDIPQSSEMLADDFESFCSHSAITMQCRVSRKPGYFVVNCLLPTLMITLCVFFTFMMDYSRYQYRFSLLFTTMLTSITFRWAIHGRVLPTISYLTFLDVYCVSSIMIVFSCMVWHAIYLVIYKENDVLAERCDRYAMIVFAIVVFLIHVMQTIWFVIAFRKRLHLEKLDKKAAISLLKNRMMNSNKTKTEASSISDFENNKLNVNINDNNNKLSNNKKSTSFSTDNLINNNNNNNSNNSKSSSKLLAKRQNYTKSLQSDKNSIINYSNKNDNNKNSLDCSSKLDDTVICSNETTTTTKMEKECDEDIFSRINTEFIDENISTISSNDGKQLLSSNISKNSTIYFSMSNKADDKTSPKELNYQYIPLIHQSSRDS